MNARCVICTKIWNVSIYAKIPETGYVCPKCANKRKKIKR